MPTDDQRRFAVTVSGLAPETFEVVSFSGHEALSELYAFDLVLVSGQDNLDPEAVIASPATLRLGGQGQTFAYHGLVAAFEQSGTANAFTVYRLRLVPRPYLLTLGENYRIFLDKPLNVFLEELFREQGLSPGVDFEFRLAKSYPARPLVAQFRESGFAFASRWMERDGLYFFFEQGPSGARMVVTDTKSAHKPLPGKAELRYATPSGLVPDQDQEAVSDFRRRLRPVPQSVCLTDWNYETPSVDLTAKATVLADGRGVMRLFGDHFRTPDEGRDLAAIRAEELLCRRDVAEGATGFPGLAAGGLLRLANHFQTALNREYLVTAVRHEGRQFGFLTSGLGLAHEPDGAPETFYRNTFTAIPADVQFRPRRVTPWPRQEGLVSAVIDAAGSDKYAEVDDQGRYKVKLAYDRSGREGGKASCWIRMAQPYGGSGHGLHFPLHKGCEVVLACQDGDPDRPVILGALPNPEHKSVVTSANQTRVNLETSGKNQIYFEDKEGSQRALLQNTPSRSFLRLGVPNDPFLDFEKETPDEAIAQGQTGLALQSPYGINVVCGSMIQTYLLGYIDTMLALQTTYFLTNTGLNVGVAQAFTGHTCEKLCKKTEIEFVTNRLHASKTDVEGSKTTLVGELITAKTTINTLDTDIQHLSDHIATMRGDVTRLASSVSQLVKQKTDLCGEVSELYQQQTDLRQENSTLATAVQELAQSKIDLHTEVTNLAGEVSSLNETAMELSKQRTSLFVQYSVTASDISTMSAYDVTI